MVAPGPGGPWYRSPVGMLIEILVVIFIIWLILHVLAVL